MDINDDSQSSSGRVVVVRKTSLLKSSQFGGDKTKRKMTNSGKDWAPNSSFSTEFTCLFCNEKFSKDYKLKLHLMLNHKNENPAEMVKAEEVLTKSKLDGCIHKCAVCSSKYNSVANFTRHIKDVHNITRAGMQSNVFFLNNSLKKHGRPQGRARGGPCPPWPAKIVCFLTFFAENSIFLDAF